jgi:hypothetical protein
MKKEQSLINVIETRARMKVSIFVTLFSVLCVFNSFAQPCGLVNIPTQNLVGYWPFCGNANDESGNGNDGVVNGATLTEDRFGNVGSAFSFDGIDDAIEVIANGDLLPNHITLSCWIKPFSGGHIIRSRFFGYIIFYDPNTNTVTFQLHHDSPEQSWTLNSFVAQDWNDNEWHLITGTFDGIENRLYVDGELVSTLPASTPNIIYQSDGLVVFGRDGNTGAGASHFNGVIDDIGIWNRALAPQEITSLYTGEPVVQPACAQLDPALQEGLVGYWPFCGNPNDEREIGNDGSVYGATLTTDRFGNSSSAYRFNGTSDFIEVNHNDIYNQMPLTMSVWVRSDGDIDAAKLITKYCCSSWNGE